MLLKVPLSTRTTRLFTTDWSKDREKAAEKEFMMREEKKKMQELKTKLKEEARGKRYNPIGDSALDIDDVLGNREWLIVG